MKLNGFAKISEIVAENSGSATRTIRYSSSTVNRLAAMLGCTISVMTAEEYEALEAKDADTLYIVTGVAEFTCYYGTLPLAGGGSGSNTVVTSALSADGSIIGVVAEAAQIEEG